MNGKEIESIVVDGWDRLIVATLEEPIRPVHKCGEMSMVDWYSQGNTEYNGKYVIAINYKE